MKGCERRPKREQTFTEGACIVYTVIMTNDTPFQPFPGASASDSNTPKPKITRPKQRITARALLDIKRPSDPQIHPDGQRVAFVVTEADFDESRYVSHLWLTEHLLPEADEEAEDDDNNAPPRLGGKNAPAAPTTKTTVGGGTTKQEASAGAEGEPASDAAPPEHDPTRQLTFSGDGETQPRWSPDGRYLAFLSSRLDETEPVSDDDDVPTDQVWILPIDGGEARKLTSAKEGVLDYAWVQDSETIVYLASEPRPRPLESLRKDERARRKIDPIVEQDDRLRRQLWRMGVDDSKPKLLYGGDYGLAEFAVSPDGQTLAFTTNYTGEGNDYHLADLYVRYLESGKTCKLIAREGGKYHLRWSPDSRQLAFLSWYDPQLSYSRECVFVADVPPASAPNLSDLSEAYGTDAPGITSCRLLFDLDYDIGVFEWAHREEPEETEDAEQNSDTQGAKGKNTPDGYADASSGLEVQEVGAVLRLACNDTAPAQETNTDTLVLGYALAAVRTGAELYSIHADNTGANSTGETGTQTRLLAHTEPASKDTNKDTNQNEPLEPTAANAPLIERQDMARDPGSDALVYVQESATFLPEIALRDPDGVVHILTKLNKDFTDSYLLPRQEVVSWTTEDGLTIEGVLTYPAEGQEKGERRKEKGNAGEDMVDAANSEANHADSPPFLLSPFSFPLIVQIHGGPKGRSANTLQNYSMAPVWASEGYAVLRPNFRGSEGYGNAFAIANRRDLGGGDFRDIMAGVDHVIKMGVADGERLGVMGGSYGGYMTNWVIGHTDRFKGAVSMFGIFHLQTDYSNSELSRWENDYLGGYYWQDPEIYRRLSPGSYVEAIKTPTLIIHGDDDTNTFISNSKELYQALRHRGVAAQFVHYPREGHGVREPNHKLDEVRRCLAWMDKHVRHAGQNPTAFRIGDRVPDPAGAMELNVQRAEIATFTGQPKPKAQDKSTQSAGTDAANPAAPVLLEVAFTLHHLDTRRPASALTFDLSNVRLEPRAGRGASDSAPAFLLPIGVPLDTLGGKVLIEGDNLRTTQQPDPDTGQLAFGCAVVFRVTQDGGEGLLRVADFPPVTVQWSSDDDDEDEEHQTGSE